MVQTFFLFSFSFAQFTDNFNDGDFTNNPTWSGDDAKFEVDASFQLHLNAPVITDTAMLALSSNAINNAVWEFFVKLNFNPSSTNFAKVFVVSDAANLKSSLNGYFVRVGHTSDDISLFKKNGTTETVIIDGVDGRLNSSIVNVSIKLTRDSVGNWELFSDTTGGNNYFPEGSGTDATFQQSSFSGVYCQYTSTRSDKFYFDNFNVTGTAFVDTISPSLNTVSVISSTQLDLKFSEFVELSSSENETNYVVNNSIGNPVSSVRDAADSSIVHLTFSNAFVNGVTNTITVSNIQDLAGNTIATTNQDFTYFVAIPASFKDVLINEFMAILTPDPASLPDREYIELYNNSSKVFDLAGWKYVNGTNTKILSSFILLPDSFLILCSTSDTALFFPYGNVLGISSWPALVDGGASLSLSDENDNIIDALTYSSSWNGFTGGKSMELVNPNNPCSGANNWIASNDSSGGTPGKINSVYSNAPDTIVPSLVSVTITSSNTIDLTFSEPMDSASLMNGIYTINNGLNVVAVAVLPANFTFVTLTLNPQIDTGIVYTVSASNVSDCSGNLIGVNDSLQFLIGAIPSAKDVIFNEFMAKLTPDPASLPDKEYFELYNNSSKVFNLSGWKYQVNTTSKTLSSFILYPNTYLILCSSADTSLFSSYGNVLGISWENLTDAGANLSLYDDKNNFVDFVNYSSSWNGFTGGKSMELKNPANPCSGVSNWTASIDASGGTPGKINSVFSTAPDTTKPTISGVTVLSQNQIQIDFSESMDSASLFTNYTINNSINVTSVQPEPDFTSVVLNVSPTLDSAIIYTGNIFSVSDCPGNTINNEPFSFAIGVAPIMSDILLNEIYADPDATLSSLPEVEFVELYNKTYKAINLNGCKFSDGSSSATISNSIIFPNEYLILCPSSSFNDYKNYGRVIGLSSWPALNNAGDNLSLKDASGNLIHGVNYSDDWYADDEKKKGGWTLEMIDPDNPCGEENNWRASEDTSGGTPGKINSVKGINPDVTPPQLTGAFAPNLLTVLLSFNERIDSLSAVNASYSINNGISISSVSVIAKDTVQLNLSNALQVKVLYMVTVNGTSDCIGNSTANSSAKFALAEQGIAGDLIINEVLFDPRTDGAEFVEIYNNSEKVINLQNWSLAKYPANSSTYIKTISELPLIIFPKQYMVFTTDTENIKTEYPLGKPENYFQVKTMISLNNDSSTLILMTNDSIVVDVFSYDKKMHFALLKETKGISLERIDFNRPTNDAGNWHSAAESVGWATPGYQNSQYDSSQGDGSEVSLEPELFSPDNDGFNDVLNIHYKFENPGFVATVQIYDAKGRLIKRIVKSQILSPEGIFTWDGTSDNNEKARIGIYLVYFEAFDLSGKVLHYKKTCVVAGKMN